MKKIKIFVFAMLLVSSTIVLTGCYDTSTHAQLSAQQEEAQKEFAGRTLPRPDSSQDWDNIYRRIEFLNQSERVGYLYLLSDTGVIIDEIMVRGKVTSLRSYITPMEEVHYSGNGNLALQAPDLDGTYGENVDGIFWFDVDGVYGEWPGLYLYTSQRRSMNTQPVLIEIEP